jgi:hypothetical protein
MVSGLGISIGKVKFCCHSRVENGKDVSTFQEGFINAGKHWNCVPKAIYN